METIESVADMRALAARLRPRRAACRSSRPWGRSTPATRRSFRPPVAAGGAVVVSIFVNPLSFGSNENFAGYPRSPGGRPRALRQASGVAAVFSPSVEEIYPQGLSTYVTEERVSKPLCGDLAAHPFPGGRPPSPPSS